MWEGEEVRTLEAENGNSALLAALLDRLISSSSALSSPSSFAFSSSFASSSSSFASSFSLAFFPAQSSISRMGHWWRLLVAAVGRVFVAVAGRLFVAAVGRLLVAVAGWLVVAAKVWLFVATAGRLLVAAVGRLLLAAVGRVFVAAAGRLLLAAGGWLLLAVAVCGAVGCEAPRRLVSYPPGALPVRFEQSTSFSTCLAASVVMAANYLEGWQRFKLDDVVTEIKSQGGDETRVADLKEYMAGKGLYLFSAAGRTDDNPPLGMGYWIRERGYPVICIINRLGTGPGYNHAVVVIGMSENLGVETADTIYYLDPSSERPLFTCGEGSFEEIWSRCGHAMLIVARRPAGNEADAAGGRPNEPGRSDGMSSEVEP